MASLNAEQERELTYLTGITAKGAVASQSFWTWNGENPAGYLSTSNEAKWGPARMGTGATVTVSFDAASNWSASEKAAFQSALHLWSEVADVRFATVSDANANIVFQRGHDGSAETSIWLSQQGAINGAQLGTLSRTTIAIDTSGPGFGPIGADFSVYGGYPWQTIVHEIGHALGLGHPGAYNDGEINGAPALTQYDNTAFSIMSYFDGNRHSDTDRFYDWGQSSDGSPNVALTPMLLDIAAIQRIYGVANTTPLSGGQVFGFHTNITGDTAKFFDFTVDRAPVVTLWDRGTGNTIDVSGFAQGNSIDLHEGTFSGVGGHQANVAIAFGTRIDTAIGGAGLDALWANDNGDVLMGGGNSDSLIGGAGNDHLYGNMGKTVQGSEDGADTIYTGGGTNYVNGNAGDDSIYVEGDVNRISGGAGNDTIAVMGGTNHINGNLGNDIITLGKGDNFAYGGRDNDYIYAGSGNNVVNGDLGNDSLFSGTGVELMTGGQGQDYFVFDSRPDNGGAWISHTGLIVSPLSRAGQLSGYHDEITDFTHGEDKITILVYPDDATHAIIHQNNGSVFESFDKAAAYAKTAIGTSNAIAALQVGNDTYLFYDAIGSGAPDSAIKLDGVLASQVQGADFVF